MTALHDSIGPILTSHWTQRCVSRLYYHVTWTTRGKRGVLVGSRREGARSVLALLAQDRGVRLEAIAILPDRIHLVISLRPTDCAASVVRELRGRSALLLLREQPDLRVALGGNLVWSESYGITTVGPRTLPQWSSRLARIEARSAPAENLLPPCTRT